MNELTQDIQRLMLHAKFEEVCALAPCKEAIRDLCTKICEADPGFFSNNEAFESWYEDGYSEYSDFELMVEALKDLHGARLQIDDKSSFFYSMMNRYAIPELHGEKRWGDAVDQVLDVLEESVGFAVTMYTSTDEIRLSQSPDTDPSDIVEAEFVEVA